MMGPPAVMVAVGKAFTVTVAEPVAVFVQVVTLLSCTDTNENT